MSLEGVTAIGNDSLAAANNKPVIAGTIFFVDDYSFLGKHNLSGVVIGHVKKSQDGIDMIESKTRNYCFRCNGCNDCILYFSVKALRAFCVRGPKVIITSSSSITSSEAIKIIWSSSLTDQDTLYYDIKWIVKTQEHHFQVSHEISFVPDDVDRFLHQPENRA
jgi:hypothetical protein